MDLDDRRIFAARAQRAYTDLYVPRAPTRSAPERFAFHDIAIDHIGSGADLRYLEFGVARGASIRRFAQHFTNPKARFVGFDSFEGLPQAWHKYEAGHFSTKGSTPAIDDSRVSFVKGWFQNTLPDFLRRMETEREPEVTLVHFDADLYSSTLFLLTALWWRIPEYFFIYDEFYGEEMIALHDFASAYPVEIEFFAYLPGKFSEKLGSHPPHKLFGRMRVGKLSIEAASKAEASLAATDQA